MTPSRLAVKSIFFINGFMQANLIARIPRLMEMFTIDNKTLGVALFALALGAVLAMPFTGWLVSKTGARKVAVTAVVLYCSIFPLVPLMPGVPGLIAIFFALGAVSGMMNVAINTQAIGIEQALGRPIMTSFHAVFSIGVFIGAACGSMFIKLEFTLFTHLLLLAVINIVGVVFAFPHLKETKPGAHEGSGFKLPNASMVSIGVILFCCVVGEGAMSEWSTNYMVNVANASQVLAPWGLSAFACAMTIGRVFGDRARERLKDKNLMIICSLVAISGLAFAISVNHPVVVMAGFFLVGLGLSVIIPVAYSVACTSGNVPPAVAIAMVGTIGYLGLLFGSPLIGFLADWQSLRFALSFVALLFIVMASLSMFQKRRAIQRLPEIPASS